MTRPRIRVVHSLGMGVDSAAILTRWLLDPGSRLVPAPGTGELVLFDLADLVVVTAMTGDEYAATAQAMETYLLPLMARAGVRYVQLCRAGQSDSDGVAVLSDSRDTRRMVMRGPWALSMELDAVGTLPQVASGKRWCSMRAKGWVIDTWLAGEFGDADRVHVVGFAAEEAGRAAKDTSYTQAARTPDYPLIRWNWDRTRCMSYLREVYAMAVDWPRSCCSYCPFQAGPEIARMIARWRAEPDAAVRALVREARALALNPRMKLFGKQSAREVAESYGLRAIVAAADDEMAGLPATVYEVRRVFRRAGDRLNPAGDGWVLGPDASAKSRDVWRSLRTLHTGTHARMVVELRREQAGRGGELETAGGVPRLWLQRLPKTGVFPATEHYLVVAPAGFADKERKKFDALWTWTRGLDLPRQADLFEVA